MNELQTIEGFSAKVYGTQEQPLFLAKDIAELLEQRDSNKVARLVDEDEKLTTTMWVAGQNREVTMLTEDGLYEVLMTSRKPIAKEFKKKVKQVLKDIRKHGMYAKDELLDNPDLLIETATRLKQEKERRIAAEAENLVLEQQVAESRPKADYYDRIMKSESLVTISQIAEDYGWSAQKMNAELHKLKVQHKVGGQWLLYAKHKNSGYTFSETTDIMHADGSTSVKMRTKWTQKGRVFIYNLLKQHDVLPSIER